MIWNFIEYYSTHAAPRCPTEILLVSDFELPQQATTGKHARVSGKKRDKQIEKYSFHTAINSLEIINKFIHILAILLRVSLAVSKNQLSWGD